MGCSFRNALCSFTFIFLAWTSNALAVECGSNTPWGAPNLVGTGPLYEVCHEGYASGLDPATREPRWVAYELVSEHSLGCLSRRGSKFVPDSKAPASDQASRIDYFRSGYDLGHLAPNQDFAWSAREQLDTFTFANAAPQLPGLNRQGWERLEEDVRAWALQRHKLVIYTGPIYRGRAAIGPDRIPIPSAFFKVIVDPRANEFIAFVMPQALVKKSSVSIWRTPLSEIEMEAGIRFPLPAGIKEAHEMWGVDLSEWRSQHRLLCGR